MVTSPPDELIFKVPASPPDPAEKPVKLTSPAAVIFNEPAISGQDVFTVPTVTVPKALIVTLPPLPLPPALLVAIEVV